MESRALMPNMPTRPLNTLACSKYKSTKSDACVLMNSTAFLMWTANRSLGSSTSQFPSRPCGRVSPLAGQTGQSGDRRLRNVKVAWVEFYPDSLVAQGNTGRDCRARSHERV